jgi:L-ascorbate metabolism protein UlaG (beta-lactamase superfamily)
MRTREVVLRFLVSVTAIILVGISVRAAEAATSSGEIEGSVTVEYIAHASFRITSPGGKKLLIDPYASRVWLGYDFPAGLDIDAVLISHPHYDHDGGVSGGGKGPWEASTMVLRTPGTNTIGDITVVGFPGKHADPWGKEFGQSNTVWLVQVSGLRIVHVGDNGPLGEKLVRQLGHVDILMLPIDSKNHILKPDQIAAIRKELSPAVLIPMHYRHGDLELEGKPDDLGDIEPWAQKESNVSFSGTNRIAFLANALPREPQIIVLRHSPLVTRVDINSAKRSTKQ